MNNRIYNPKEAIVFRKTTEKFGGLSNMASGYSLYINEIVIPSAEHLYQAMRYPHSPQIQFEIINQDNAMLAKKISNKYKDRFSRPDWAKVQTKIMRWALEIKLSQNWDKFSEILKQTHNLPIVEYSLDDKIWGAKPDGDNLIGINALGRLLMQLRESYVLNDNRLYCVNPPDVAALLLYNQKIETICDDLFIGHSNEDMLEPLFL
jgi:ribA/ribD-fused uncharacterized protein